MRYVALIDGHEGAYGVTVPDLPGCFSGGATVEEALANAQEAVVMWIEEMESQGGDIPAPRSAEDAMREFTGIITLVPLVRDSGRAKRVNLSLDTGLLEAIDDAAAMHKLTRSAFLASAAREKIAHEG